MNLFLYLSKVSPAEIGASLTVGAIFDPMAIHPFQQLMAMKYYLIESNGSVVLDINHDQNSPTSPRQVQLNSLLFFSYLWVLGNYELIRAIDQRNKERKILNQTQEVTLSDCKNMLARLRMPMAKFEAESKHRGTDSGMAYPIVMQPKGIGWALSRSTAIFLMDIISVLDRFVVSMQK